MGREQHENIVKKNVRGGIGNPKEIMFDTLKW